MKKNFDGRTNITPREVADLIQYTFNYIDKEELNKLVETYDPNEVYVTPDVVFDLFENVAFARDYADLADAAVNSSLFKHDDFYGDIDLAQFEYVKVNAADGNTSAKTGAFEWVSGAVGWLTNLGTTAGSLYQIFTGKSSGATDADADIAKAAAEAEAAKSKIMMVGIIFAVVVVVIVILVVALRK
jgi:hypothetical protein